MSGVCDVYWNKTETFEALCLYIDMNFEGLRDDVFTLLVHLGYHFDEKTVFIPNHEIRREFVNAISLVLYAARNFYTLYREFPTGKGFADMVFLPRKKFPDKPAIVVELKWNKSAKGAISQIKEKEYCRSLEEYHGNILLVGINYDKNTRKHECIIEECER